MTDTDFSLTGRSGATDETGCVGDNAISHDTSPAPIFTHMEQDGAAHSNHKTASTSPVLFSLDAVELWLSEKELRLAKARHLFSGRPMSAVMLDPVGLKFPREWYPYMLRYTPGVGLMPAEENPAYVRRKECA